MNNTMTRFIFILIILCLMIACNVLKADELPKFTFNYNGGLKVIVQAETRDQAFRKAAKLCFQALTKGKYQGEEKSLDIIDICANPKRGY